MIHEPTVQEDLQELPGAKSALSPLRCRVTIETGNGEPFQVKDNCGDATSMTYEFLAPAAFVLEFAYMWLFLECHEASVTTTKVYVFDDVSERWEEYSRDRHGAGPEFDPEWKEMLDLRSTIN